MPAIASITVNDREDTPVSHTFEPKGQVANGVWLLKEGTGVPFGENKLTISQRQTGSGLYRPKLVLALPTVVNETIDGVTVPSVARTAYVTVEATFDEKSTEQERSNAIGIVANAMLEAQTVPNDVFVNLESIW